MPDVRDTEDEAVMPLKSVIFFDNGNTAAFDESGEQMPDLQHGWLLLYLELLVHHGHLIEGVEFTLPSGRRATPFMTGEGSWNWTVK